MDIQKTFLMTRFLIILLCGLWFNAQGQEAVQWASRVIEVSSELQDADDASNKQYKATQALGKPNKLPATGKSPCAWSPASATNPAGEFIKVGFDKPMVIQQIAIAENHNPGAITHIYLYDESGKEYPAIYQNTNITNLHGGRMFRINIQPTNYKVAAIKLQLNPLKINDIPQIDAIGISNSNTPIEAVIKLADELHINDKAENLGSNINSKYQEVSPIISPDGKTLYFTRYNHPDNIGDEKRQDVWYAERQADGNFGPAKNIGPPINTDHHNSSFSITPDGSKMLLNNIYNADGTMTKGLSITTLGRDGQWGNPQPVTIENYYNKNRYSEFCLSADGKILLMTAQRDDSFGGKDLYVSFKKGENLFSTPKNLGPIVNTADSETSPFLAADNTTLYYATAGLSGYGSYDIFVTRRLDDSWLRWSEPENLGPSINTPNWDAYFNLTASGEYAYFTSYHNAIGDGDIFRIKLSEKEKPKPVALVKGVVYDAITKKPINAEINYQTTPKNDSLSGTASTRGSSGEYQVVLQMGNDYALRAEAKGFFAADESITLATTADYSEITKDFYLMPVQKGQTVRLQNIFFVRAKDELMEESFPELDRLSRTMLDNPTMVIELQGHTEPFGDKKELLKLSEKRVIAVRKYLSNAGVEESRVQYKAFGGKKPINTGRSEEARAINRRVEVKVLEQ
jgi:outer membrane protein OmpA-like peptidoglycan-associated protein